MRIVFATGNNDKMREIRQILGGFTEDIVSMKDAGIDIDIVEDGSTFEENAMIKARAVHEHCKDAIVLADDSGLEIDFLNKEPGIYSARYLGRETPYPEKNAIILDKLKDVPDEKRSARFVCAIAACLPGGEEIVVRGTMEGRIGYEIAGENGFGYDPIFFLPEYGKTSAELLPEEKNAVSHRGKALRMMEEKLKEIFNA
ncbi:XTP/dITP diphosphatase [Butyrivibrio sp. WCD3002]|uniref:XTP/dITP diphosphatase n=1 Tax=Butyrivibrio sp. WCD3002 TaxID=1280676 RepID=UPI00042A0105|nr:XTP/dITP diphosphatase [Butyrivibrio sp. WCD3002]